MSNTRVVVTGYGAVTPVGNSVDEMWNSLRQGKSGIALLTREISKDHLTIYGGEIKNLNPENFLEKKELRKMDFLSVMSTIAAIECVGSSKITLEEEDKFRIGCILGVGMGGVESFLESVALYAEKKWKGVPVMTVPKIIPNSASANVALKLHNICGPNYTVNTACSSSSDAIAAAVRHIKLGEADFVFAGGAEATVLPFVISSFNVMHALSTKWTDEPHRASRPFDRDRDGFVIAEGAAVLAVESLEHAQKRNAQILAEIVGYANTNDGYHYTAPDPTASAIIEAMHQALRRAGIEKEEIGYINAHGTSTQTNDPMETGAIKKVFGDHAYKLKISSTKSMTGHCIGATGAIEAIACVKALETQFVPPTINLENPDPECDLDYVPNKGEPLAFRYAMSNTLGFGGHNGILIFKKFEQ